MKRNKNHFITQIVHIFLVGVVALTLTSCSGDDGGDNSTTSNTSSPFGSLSGNFTGSIQDSAAGTGTVRGTLSQSGTSISGTLQTFFANPNNNNSGTVSGTVNGTSVTLVFTSSVPTACPFNITLTQTSNTQLSGTYAAFNCTVAVGGTVSITRQ
jgi:hypothetical protein